MDTIAVHIGGGENGVLLTLENSRGLCRYVFATRRGVVFGKSSQVIKWAPILYTLGLIEDENEEFYANKFCIEKDDGGTVGLVIFDEPNLFLWLTTDGIVGGEGTIPWSSVVPAQELSTEA